jgi:hypothetical protein
MVSCSCCFVIQREAQNPSRGCRNNQNVGLHSIQSTFYDCLLLVREQTSSVKKTLNGNKISFSRYLVLIVINHA